MKTYAIKNTASDLNLALCLGLLNHPAIAGRLNRAGDRYRRSTAEYIDDLSLQSRVQRALARETGFKFDCVKVAVFKATIQLTGFVDSLKGKMKAGSLARQISGVRNIENTISIQSESQAGPAESVSSEPPNSDTPAARDHATLKAHP